MSRSFQEPVDPQLVDHSYCRPPFSGKISSNLFFWISVVTWIFPVTNKNPPAGGRTGQPCWCWPVMSDCTGSTRHNFSCRHYANLSRWQLGPAGQGSAGPLSPTTPNIQHLRPSSNTTARMSNLHRNYISFLRPNRVVVVSVLADHAVKAVVGHLGVARAGQVHGENLKIAIYY